MAQVWFTYPSAMNLVFPTMVEAQFEKTPMIGEVVVTTAAGTRKAYTTAVDKLRIVIKFPWEDTPNGWKMPLSRATYNGGYNDVTRTQASQTQSLLNFLWGAHGGHNNITVYFVDDAGTSFQYDNVKCLDATPQFKQLSNGDYTGQINMEKAY